jgi:hypothetical protein
MCVYDVCVCVYCTCPGERERVCVCAVCVCCIMYFLARNALRLFLTLLPNNIVHISIYGSISIIFIPNKMGEKFQISNRSSCRRAIHEYNTRRIHSYKMWYIHTWHTCTCAYMCADTWSNNAGRLPRWCRRRLWTGRNDMHGIDPVRRSGGHGCIRRHIHINIHIHTGS